MLASSVQRSKPTPYPSKARSALIRRAIVVALVLVALTLVTISFRSPTAGALHDVQGAGSTALRPFQIAATRVAAPFRDAYDYVHSLANAKSQNQKLRKENQQLRLSAVIAAGRAAKYPALSGVRLNSPVVSGDGLVGIVSNVFPHTAEVTLLTDPDSFVAARDVNTQVRGMVHTGPGGTLILDQVQKQLKVKPGDEIVTAGTRNARYPDLYPYGIPIGRVSPGGVSASDTATFLQVQVQPFANLDSLDAVGVLVPKKPRR